MSDFMITRDDGSQKLLHYGIKGQKWGDRNYQYEDGTLTPEGIKRYRELKKKYKTANINNIPSDNIKGNRLTDKGYDSVYKEAHRTAITSGPLSKGMKIAVPSTAGIAAISAIDAGLTLGPLASLTSLGITLPLTAGAAIVSQIAKRNYANSKQIINQTKDTTTSEVNEYLALKAAKNKE